MIPFFKTYEQYCANYATSNAKVVEMRKRKEIAKFLDQGEETVQRKIEALLITPVQRLPRYVMLLRDLRKHTEKNHPDYDKLGQIAQSIERVADSVNQGMRSFEKRRTLIDLQERGRFPGLDAYVVPHREFIEWSRRYLLCFVFCFLFCFVL